MRGVYYSSCSLCYKTIAQFHQKCLLMRDCLLCITRVHYIYISMNELIKIYSSKFDKRTWAYDNSKTYFANSSKSGTNVILIDLDANGHQKRIFPASIKGSRQKTVNKTLSSMFVSSLFDRLIQISISFWLRLFCTNVQLHQLLKQQALVQCRYIFCIPYPIRQYTNITMSKYST